MSSLLTTKRMSIVPTMRCTLRCKLCSNHIPVFSNPVDATGREMMRDIDLLFELFDRIEWLQFVGGEIFMHPEMAEVYAYCQKYRSKFDKLILETNATILPTKSEIETICSYKKDVNIMLSDYGELSIHLHEFVHILESNGIPYTIKKYHGDQQHFNGWIDNTGRRNYEESDEMIAKYYPRCPQMKLENMHCYRGELHACPNSLFMSALGLFSPADTDYVNLTSDLLSLKEKREIIRNFYAIPNTACRYCMWKYADTMPRYPAAEQIP